MSRNGETSRICVVMGDDRPVVSGVDARRSYPSLAYEINRRFCAAKGWDFRYEQYRLPSRPWGKLAAYSATARQHRGASWVKILAILRALDLGYELVIWIDSDCIFYNHDADWSDFLGLFRQPDLQFAAWVDRPYHLDQPCCGFFAIRNSQRARSMLETIWGTRSRSATCHPYEQDEFVAFLKARPPTWHHLVDEPAFRLEEPGQRLLHLANFSNSLRIPEFTRWFEECGTAPHPQGLESHVFTDLDVDAADLRLSRRAPGPVERARRELWGIREAGQQHLRRAWTRLIASAIGPTVRKGVDSLRARH